MARAKLNNVLVTLIVAVGRLSATGHDFCFTNAMDVGIRVPSANHPTRWLRAYARSFNLQPSILLEPTGIYGLRADGLNGWQKAGVWSTEFVAGAVGYAVPAVPAIYIILASSNDFDNSATPWQVYGFWPGSAALLCPTAVWLTGHYGFKQDVSWWQPALGSVAGTVVPAGLLLLSDALRGYRGRSTVGTAAIDFMYDAGSVGIFVLPPIGAVIGANHR